PCCSVSVRPAPAGGTRAPTGCHERRSRRLLRLGGGGTTSQAEMPRPSADATFDDALRGRFVPREQFEGGEGWSGVVTPVGAPDQRLFAKILPPGTEFAEASLLASLHHPQIPRVVESGVTADGRPFFVRELVAGRPLHQAFPLTPEEAVECAEQLLEVLAYVHLRGILHLDLKPGNVVRAEGRGGPRYHLLDFGLGRRGRGRAAGGTPFFAPPETLLGLPASPRSDLFSLGAVLFVALRPPDRPLPLARFLNRFPHDDFFAALGEEPYALPAPFATILPRLLARRPEERYADAQEALEAFTGGSGRPSPEILALDPIATFGDVLLRAIADVPTDTDVVVCGGGPDDRRALALHAACALPSVQRIAVERDACRLVRGGAPVSLQVPRLALGDG